MKFSSDHDAAIPRRSAFASPWVSITSQLRDISRALLLALAMWETPVAADPLALVTLQWQAPVPCPDAAALQAELRRDLAGSQAPGERLAVQASVEPTAAESWRVHIHMQGGEGNSDRVLTARSCIALADATSLIIAMHIDPETAAAHAHSFAEVSEPALAPAPGAMPIPSAPVVAYPGQLPPPALANAQGNAAVSETKTIKTNLGTERDAAAGKLASERTTFDAEVKAAAVGPSRTQLHPLVGAWALVDWGSLPLASPGFGGSAGLASGPWMVEIAIGAWLNRDKTKGTELNPHAGIKLGMVSGAARLCHRIWEHAPFDLSPCAGFELVRWSGEGNSYLAGKQTGWALGFSPNARLLGTLSISEVLCLPVFLDVLLPLNRPKFGFQDAAGAPNYVYQPSQVALRVGVGVQLHFR